MVYGLPWLDKTAITWSTGDKMVYGLLRSIGLDKTAIGAIKWSTGDKMVYVDKTASGGNRINGLRAIKWSTGCLGLDKTAIGAIKWSTGNKMVYVDKTASGGNKMVYGR